VDKVLRPSAAGGPLKRVAYRHGVLAGTGTDLALIAAWLAFIAGVHVWGEHLRAAGQRLFLHAAPLFGRLDLDVTWRLAAAVVIGAAVVAFGDRVATRLIWRALLIVVMSTAVLWSSALAFEDGISAIGAPLESGFDYLVAVDSVGSPARFVSTFTEQLTSYPIHVQGHPPGFVLLLWGMAQVGLGGSGPAAAVVIITGASAGAAALVALKALAGESHARRAAPFVALAPAAIWIATSADAFYAGVSAWGIALFAVASSHRDRRSGMLAISAGVVGGAALLLSYGAAALAPIPAAIAVVARRLRPLALASVGVALVGAAALAGGFWWLDGLGATTLAYRAGAAAHRPGAYFLVANLAAFSIALGPAAAAAVARLRHPKVWILVGGALAAVLAADLSGLSKGEVERIWLPFVPWVLLATCALRGPARRAWLGAQATVALTVQAWVQTPW